MTNPSSSNELTSLATYSDGITQLGYFEKDSNKSLLAATSWDGSVRLHDVSSQTTRATVLSHAMESGPLLSLACLHKQKMDCVATGGLDGSVKMLDIESSVSTLIGKHETTGTANTDSKQACSCLNTLGGGEEGDPNLLVSASWARTLHLWDIRQQTSVSQLALPGKAFAMDVDVDHQRVVVATSGRRICFVDVRKGSSCEIVVDRESSLKYQTRDVKFFPSGNGVALGSIEGRVGIEWLPELSLPAPMKKYAFKCHRVNDTVYPVNCICFHPRFVNTFATGGGDGSVVLWDGMNKKKLTTLPSCPTSISAITFNQDGTEIAIASSYTYEEGERDVYPKDEIFTRSILESECMPKEK